MFQRVVKTVEGVRSDAIFSYLPPVNILALTFLTPLTWVVSPRTLHRINVFCIRLTVSRSLCIRARSPPLTNRASRTSWLYQGGSDGSTVRAGRFTSEVRSTSSGRACSSELSNPCPRDQS
jgi:hypothetical protein